ncbi:MAG: cytochrome c biogenesis protein CcsA [Bdellovibrionales bacterium]|nr:cytochrome c biogenesis protein CcsA [Bdellovibrionales bacterium]
MDLLFRRLFIPLLVVSFALIGYANYLVFLVVPNERVMGAVQRIFYFHVGSAIACYCSVALVLLGSIGYLATRDSRADAVARAAAEVGFLFCTITLVSGMIWGHSAWNTWFRWEPRLVTFLLLWFLLLAMNLLRVFGDPERTAMHSAVLGILGALNVPLIVFSIDFLPQAHQLHPKVVGTRGLKDPSYYRALAVSVFALAVFQFLLVSLRTRIEVLLRRKIVNPEER